MQSQTAIDNGLNTTYNPVALELIVKSTMQNPNNRPDTLYNCLVAIAIAAAAPAYGIPSYQCVANGKVVYQAFPCPTTTQLPAEIQQQTNEQDLIVFSRNANEEKVYQLLSQGTSANAIDDQHNSALFYALEQQHYSIAKLLIRAKARVDFVLASGLNLLMHFAAIGDLTAVNILLDNAAPLEEKASATGDTALAVAVKANQSAVIKLLLAKGANPNCINNDGLTPLIFALSNNAKDSVNILLANNANLDQLSRPLGQNSSATPLIHFATYSKQDSVLALLQLGADVNLANEKNISPLAAAALVGDTAMVKLLLAAGANPAQVKAQPELWQHIQLQQNSRIAELFHNN